MVGNQKFGTWKLATKPPFFFTAVWLEVLLAWNKVLEEANFTITNHNSVSSQFSTFSVCKFQILLDPNASFQKFPYQHSGLYIVSAI